MNGPDPIERDRQARDIFLRAAEMPSAEAREAYLAEACGQDEALRARVLALLESHRQDSFLEGPTVDLRPITEELGDRIGRYKLLQQIGEGGMGVVYMAEQEEPVRRRVALKIIKLGMDTKQVVARFEAERQALALMDHPNIARVLDGGATETGRPYFVMELVQGVPITEFCDQNQLSTEQRLKLFIPVCQAIQSAHQKGIIHRDLKPTNILVSLNSDGSGLPKIIDFGVAKATSQKLTEKTLFTAHGLMVGTPAYMSPEQAEMSPLDVDTRADIYSLGALLYELLTSTTPFPEKRLRNVGYNEIQRIILQEEPEKPSTRLSTLRGEQRSVVGRNRGTTDLTPGRALSSDLDWIVMKCLEKDRTRRYETANGLATDVVRHLNNEPIIARPASKLYRLRKAAERNKVAFAGAGAVMGALVFGLCVSTWALVRERAARREAEASGNLARTEAARNEAVNRFFANSPALGIRAGQDTTIVRAIMDELSRRAESELATRPDAQGDIWVFIGSRNAELGEYPTAITNLQKAVAAYHRAYTSATPRLARALGLLGKLQARNMESAAGKSNALLGVEIARQCGDSEVLATCLLDAAKSFNESGEPTPETVPLLREAVDLRSKAVPSFLARIEGTRLLAKALAAAGRRDEAKAFAQEALNLAPSDKDLQALLQQLENEEANSSSR